MFGTVFAAIGAAITIFVMATSHLGFGLDPHGEAAWTRFHLSILIVAPGWTAAQAIGMGTDEILPPVLSVAVNGLSCFTAGAVMGFLFSLTTSPRDEPQA